MFHPVDNILGLKEQTLFGSLLLWERIKADMLTFLRTTSCCHEDSEGVSRWKQKQPENTAITLLLFHLSWAALMLGNRWSLLPVTPASRKRHLYKSSLGEKNPTFVQWKLPYWLSGLLLLSLPAIQSVLILHGQQWECNCLLCSVKLTISIPVM